MDENARKVSGSQPTHDDHDTHRESHLPFPYYLQVTQFCLRLLGVYVFLSGGADMVDQLVQVVLEWRRLVETGLLTYDYMTVGHLLGSGIYSATGVYLMLDGSWFIDKVFLPVTPSGDSES